MGGLNENLRRVLTGQEAAGPKRNDPAIRQCPQWYTLEVRRLAFAIIIGLLSLSASGISSLIVDEPCTGYELTGQGEDEGGCPPTCVTCGCCAQAAEAVTFTAADSPDAPVSDLAAVLPHFPTTDPTDILHVPKLALA